MLLAHDRWGGRSPIWRPLLSQVAPWVVLWQLGVPPVTTELSGWRPSVFGDVVDSPYITTDLHVCVWLYCAILFANVFYAYLSNKQFLTLTLTLITKVCVFMKFLWVSLILNNLGYQMTSFKVVDENPSDFMTFQICRHWVVSSLFMNTDIYGLPSNIRHTLVGNKIIDHSDVVAASPVSTVPTIFSFST